MTDWPLTDILQMDEIHEHRTFWHTEDSNLQFMNSLLLITSVGFFRVLKDLPVTQTFVFTILDVPFFMKGKHI